MLVSGSLILFVLLIMLALNLIFQGLTGWLSKIDTVCFSAICLAAAWWIEDFEAWAELPDLIIGIV